MMSILLGMKGCQLLFQETNYENLLLIIVLVYNAEKYIGKCIESNEINIIYRKTGI